MPDITDATISVQFLQSIVGQVLIILASLIAGLKYLEKRQNTKIADETTKRVDDLRKDVCSQLETVRNSVTSMRDLFNMQIKYIEKAVNHMNQADQREFDRQDYEDRQEK